MDVVPRPAALRDPPRQMPSALTHLGGRSRYAPGEFIYRQQEQVGYWYQLISGAARKSAVAADGRHHIVSFLLPGDLFGFGAQSIHRFSVEAIDADTVVARYPREPAQMLAESDAEVSRQVREAAFESIARLQMRVLLLMRRTALEKVCAFLLEMADRSASSADAVDLSMSRYDIADYLAIAVETVSRAFTVLRSRGVIAFCATRRVRIIDRNALENGGLRMNRAGAARYAHGIDGSGQLYGTGATHGRHGGSDERSHRLGK